MKPLNAFLCCLSLMVVSSGMMSGNNQLVADESAPANAVKSVKESDVPAERKMRSKPRRQKLDAARKKSSKTTATEKKATEKKSAEKITPSQTAISKDVAENDAAAKNLTAKNLTAKKIAEKQLAETKFIEKKLAEKKLAALKPADSKPTAKPSGKSSAPRFQMLSAGKRIVVLDTETGETRMIESEAETMQQSVEIGKSWVTVTVLVNAPGSVRAKPLLTAPRK